MLLLASVDPSTITNERLIGLILISACLIGCHCRYDGKTNLTASLLECLADQPLIPICPEQLGGLSTPRPPCEIHGGDGEKVLAGSARVLTHDDQDLTKAFVRGARETLYLAQWQKIRLAILKSKSPSCSPDHIYDGTFSHRLVPGQGVTATLLQQHNIDVISESDMISHKDDGKMGNVP